MTANNGKTKAKTVLPRRKSKDQIKTMLLNNDPTRDYRATKFSYWGDMLIHNLPMWRIWTGKMMLTSDPIVNFSLNVRNAALMAAKVSVTAKNPAVKEWVERQWNFLWDHHRNKITSAKKMGFAPLQIVVKQKNGLLEIKSVKDFSPEDCRALEVGSKLVGQTVKGNRLYFPQACWLTFDAEYGSAYGTGCLRRSYPAWYEKWMDHGAKRLLQLRMIKDSYIGDIFWYPPNMLVELPNGQKVSWRDMMREIGENRLSGGALTLPRLFNDKGNPLTDYSPPQDTGGGSQIFEWNDICDEGILRGAGVPMEVVKAAQTGSGYSGRSIPFLVVLSACNQELVEIIQRINEQVLRPLAWLNFGGDPEYEIKPMNLVETFSDNTQGSPLGGSAVGGQPSQAPPEQAPPQGNVQFGEETFEFDHPRDSQGRFTIKDAVTRRNIEPSGKVWHDGVLTYPTPEVVSQIIGKSRYAQRKRLLDKLIEEQKKNPKASIAEIRSHLGSDSRIASWEEAIDIQKSLVKDSEEYVKDIHLAGEFHKQSSQHAESVDFTPSENILHAPKGGVTIHGVKYKGGEFIPKEVIESLTPDDKAKLRSGAIARHIKENPKLSQDHPANKEAAEEGQELKPFESLGSSKLGALYHGSKSKLKEIDPERLQSRDYGYYGRGFYTANSESAAKNYGRHVTLIKPKEDAKVLHSALNAKEAPELHEAIQEHAAKHWRPAAEARGKAHLHDDEMKELHKSPISWKDAVDRFARDNHYDIVHHTDGEVVVKNPQAVEIVKKTSQHDEQFEEHSYSSTQFNLPGPLAFEVIQLSSKIPSSDLQPTDYGDVTDTGREMNPHITIKYGLHTNDPDEVRQAVQSHPPVAVQLGKCSFFEGEKHDVIKIDVNSESLHKLNQAVSDSLECTDTFPDYKPHITIAYVKKGLGDYYSRRLNDLEGKVEVFDWLVFSDKNRHQSSIPLTGSAQFNEGGIPSNGGSFQFVEETEAVKRLREFVQKGMAAKIKSASQRILELKQTFFTGLESLADRMLLEISRLRPIIENNLAATFYNAHLEGLASQIKEAEATPIYKAKAPKLLLPNTPLTAQAALFNGASPDDVVFPVLEDALTTLRMSPAAVGADYRATAELVRQGAFAVTGDLTEHAVADIRDTLADAMSNGDSRDEFIETVVGRLEDGGPLSEPHLENVFRTNVMSQLSNGRMRAMEQPLVADAFPYVVYFATADARVREDHLALEKLGLNGTNFYRSDDPTFLKFRPPWDYQCRCSWFGQTVEQAAEKGVKEAFDWLERAKKVAEEKGGSFYQYLSDVKPLQPEYVTPPKFEPRPEFSKGIV